MHTLEDEYFYVVDGQIVVKIGCDEHRLGAGCFAFLPRGIPHAWDVEGGTPATLLMTTIPAMLEEFLHEIHCAATNEARDAVAEKYGIQFLPDRNRNEPASSS